ncbi:hypothetical protein F3Y22_tig00110462pilonHSYRG00452 [Hibiscus syriacus]|uniref:Uncharacterized protein n=1 Tax=Hibiscus syriacus TaxID=106335 RepID=A0A6A3AKG2_HIBSY|nr:hypothetical protein F3Y22_tig00110462pilonHSYRG00452 [Hibiscus syriacus]
MAAHSDNSSQVQVSTVPSGHTPSALHQSVLPASMGPNHQHSQLQSQSHNKQVSQSQPTVERTIQQNRQGNSYPSSKSQADQQPMSSASKMEVQNQCIIRGRDNSQVTYPPVGTNAGAQWPQQPQIQQSPTPPSSQQNYRQVHQDHHSSPTQQLLLQQSQQQSASPSSTGQLVSRAF